jgi:hypothetical protein
MKTPAPGIYHDVPFEEYCAWDAINNSSLGPALKSPRHYKHGLDNPRADTDAFRFGRLCHADRLEPAAVLDRYVVMLDLSKDIKTADGKPARSPKATAEYKQRVATWEEQQTEADCEVITRQRFDEFKGVLDSLNGNKLAREWFGTDGPAELSILWKDPITQLVCKIRIDKVTTPTQLTDLKSTRDAHNFGKSIADYGYYRQAAFYLDGYRLATGHDAAFCLVAVENVAPFGVRSAPLHPAAVAAQRTEYRLAMKRIAEARANGQWKGYDDPGAWELPHWKQSNECHLMVGGESVTLN